ncbi:hypothetical protein OB920_13145 [Halobacteria archaeon HArc-gm2]|nr:hypothetical protein [Halobacteria archaeon HArc-gm2]
MGSPYQEETPQERPDGHRQGETMKERLPNPDISKTNIDLPDITIGKVAIGAVIVLFAADHFGVINVGQNLPGWMNWSLIQTFAVIYIAVRLFIAPQVTKWLKNLFRPDMQWIQSLDAKGIETAWRLTHPETIVHADTGRVETREDPKTGETIATVRDILGWDEEKPDVLHVEGVNEWDDIPSDDQIIADKTQYAQYRDIEEKAREGHKIRQGLPAFKTKLEGLLTKKFAVMYEQSTSGQGGYIDTLLGKSVEEYKQLEGEPDNFVREYANQEMVDDEEVNDLSDDDEDGDSE